MNNKILFDDNKSNENGNAELLKENTPQTVDYNKLYNIQENNQPLSTEFDNINNNATNSDIMLNRINENEAASEFDNVHSKKKGINGLLLVFLIFLIIMGTIIFLFPFLWKLTLK